MICQHDNVTPLTGSYICNDCKATFDILPPADVGLDVTNPKIQEAMHLLVRAKNLLQMTGDYDRVSHIAGWVPLPHYEKTKMEVCDGGRKASELKQDANRHSQH
jgi:hypothetical protein